MVAQRLPEQSEAERGHHQGEGRDHQRPRALPHPVEALVEHHAPRGVGRRHAEAQERQPGVDGDGDRDVDGHQDEQRGDDVGYDVPRQDPQPPRPERLLGLDVGLFPHDEDGRPCHPRVGGGEGDRDDQGDVALRGPQQGEREDDGRERLHAVHHHHEDAVDPPAEVPGEDSQQQTDDQGDEPGRDGHREGDTGSEDGPGQQVAAERVGAQQVLGGRTLQACGDVLLRRVVGSQERREEHRCQDEEDKSQAELAGPGGGDPAEQADHAPAPPRGRGHGDGHAALLDSSTRIRGSRKR